MRLLVLAVLVVTVGVAYCSLDSDWEAFKTEFKRNYKPEEEAKRKELFAKTRERVNKHNAEAAKGVHSYTLGINHFSDLTEEELKMHTGGRLPLPKP